MRIVSVFISRVLMILTVLIAQNLFAGSIELAQLFSWSFIDSQLSKNHLILNQKIEVYDLQMFNLNPRLRQIEFNSNLTNVQNYYSADKIVNHLQGHFNLSINSLTIDQIIKKEIAGNIINIRINATCKPIELSISNIDIQLNSNFVEESFYWRPSVTNLKLKIDSNSWRLGPVECFGPQGLDQMISSEIIKYLNSPELIETTLTNWLNPVVQNKWDQVWHKLLSSTQNILSDLKMLQPNNNGIIMVGKISTMTENDIVLDYNQIQDSLLKHKNLDLLKPILITSEPAFFELIKSKLYSINETKLNLQKISGFKKLMRSRFIQFFVWPDLMNFSKKAIFHLTTQTDNQNINFKKVSSGEYRIDLQTLGQIEAERDSSLQNYIDWSVGLTSILKPKIINSQLTLELSSTQSQINWKFNEAYISKYKPSKRVSKKIINNAIESLIAIPSINEELPIFEINQQKWKLNNWQNKDNLIYINWENVER